MITEFVLLFVPSLIISLIVAMLSKGGPMVFLACTGLALSVMILSGELSLVYLILPILFISVPVYKTLSGFIGGDAN